MIMVFLQCSQGQRIFFFLFGKHSDYFLYFKKKDFVILSISEELPDCVV